MSPDPVEREYATLPPASCSSGSVRPGLTFFECKAVGVGRRLRALPLGFQSLRSHVQNSRLLPCVQDWTVLSSSVADQHHCPASDHRLGKPLPHQLS